MYLDVDFLLNFNIDESVRNTRNDVYMASKGFTFIGQGKDRRTYLSKDKQFVVKLPRGKYAIDANINEHKSYRKHFDRNLAPCRLYAGKILIMRAVTSTYGKSYGCLMALESKMLERPYGPFPAWVMKFDSEQVGHLHDGRLVAFDYPYVVD